MTVAAASSVVSYVSDGATKLFTVPFVFLDDDHLRVSKLDLATPAVETVLTRGTDYTVSGEGSSSGGSVTLVVAVTAAWTVRIRRIVPLTQLSPFRAQGQFSPAAYETALDKLTHAVQQLNDGVLVQNGDFNFAADASLGPVIATGSLTARQLAVRFAEVKNVKDFGALGDGVADDTTAVAAAIVALPATGGVLFFPHGVYRIASTLTLSNRRSTKIVGQGHGHAGSATGTVLKWVGAAGGTLLHLDGWSQCSVEDLAVDGNAKSAGVGIHLDQGSTVVSQKDAFNRVCLVNCQTGLRIGTTGANQGNNDQCSYYDCWFRDNDVGVDWQGDQHVLHVFYNVQVLSNAVAGFRTGTASPNGGGFAVYTGTFSVNDIDFEIPRMNRPIVLVDIHSELSRIHFQHDTTSGGVDRVVTMMNCWQNSMAGGATDSIIFRGGNSLQMIGCRYPGAIKLDNKGAGTPTRLLQATSYGSLVKEGPTGPYKVLEIGQPSALTSNAVTTFKGDISLENAELAAAGAITARNATHVARPLAKLAGEVGVHGGGRASILNDGTINLGTVTSLTGLMVVRRTANDRAALFFIESAAVVEISDPNNTFSPTLDNAGTGNLYVSGADLIFQNKVGSTNEFHFQLLGGASA